MGNTCPLSAKVMYFEFKIKIGHPFYKSLLYNIFYRQHTNRILQNKNTTFLGLQLQRHTC